MNGLDVHFPHVLLRPRDTYDGGMSGLSTWSPTLIFLTGVVLGALLVGAVWLLVDSRYRAEKPLQPTLSVTSESLLEALPIPTVVFSDSMRPLFHNSAYEEHAAVVRRVLDKEWLQRTVLQALMERRGVSRRSDLDNQQSVHILPLPENLVAVMVWDESELYSADAMRQDFIANASHELNTPVSAIMLLSEALQKSAPEDQTTQRFVQALHGEAERLSQLTRDIGRLAAAQDRGHSGPTEVVSVVDVIDETVLNHVTLADAADVKLKWKPDAASRSIDVLVDPKMLEMALGNIIENAIRYSPAGGKVTVLTKKSSSGEQVRILITDQGPGIESDETEKIFQRFYRTDKSRERESGGTGLGLAIARNIARGAGGDVSVKTFPGEGATFIVTLPISDQTEGASR